MLYRWFVQAHSPVCSTLGSAQKKVYILFFGVVKVGGCLEGGGKMVHVSGGRGLHGVSEGGRGNLSSGLSSLGEKAGDASGGAGSDAPVPSS